MKNLIKSRLGRLLLLILTVSVILSSLVSCDLFAYTADDRAEIEENLSSATEQSDCRYVSQYLREWGFPIFDTLKMQYFEESFIQLYNYGDGLPDTFTHAKLTAELFLTEYYDGINTGNKTEVTDAILDCYVTIIGDPYSAYRPPAETDDYMTDMSGKFGGIGVMVEYNDADESIMVSTVYQGSPAEKAGVAVGDFIYAVDGRTVEELGYHNAVNYVRGEIGTDVELTLLRGDELVTVVATRAEVEEINASYSIDEENNIGYVQIVSFKDNTFPQFKEAIDALEAAGVEGIIFDLRNNPGGYVNSVVAVISYLIPDGKEVMSYDYKNQPTDTLYSTEKGEDHVVDLPFVVICNEYTASAGEIFTAAIRDYRNDGDLDATIVGTTTYKKGIMQNTYYYFDQSSVTMTVAYYNPPCGENYHGIGVTPDRIVELEKDSDTQLDAALEEMLKLTNDN